MAHDHQIGYQPYVTHLVDLLREVSAGGVTGDLQDSSEQAINGGAGVAVRDLVPLEQRRASGVFFTPHRLARSAVSTFRRSLTADSRIYDPTCGAGDLLLAAAQALPRQPTFWETISSWRSQLMGHDIYADLVQAARIRLALMAALRFSGQADEGWLNSSQQLDAVQRGSSLCEDAAFATATHVVLNPPYNRLKLSKPNRWTSGSTNAASIFVMRMLDIARPGTRFVAILPDVLRSGTLYATWRMLVEERASHCRVALKGQFSSDADVNTFILSGRVADKKPNRGGQAPFWKAHVSATYLSLEDAFSISTGPVVDFRHPKQGATYRYFTARNMKWWCDTGHDESTRQFAGTVHRGPLVVVRRTSRPSDPYRATGAIIAVDEPVAIDNHLLVAIPRDGQLATCHQLLEHLRTPATNEQLNRRIRCRHLTVGALKELPWSN